MTKDLELRLETYFDRLWPLLRSITGDGVRATHDILDEIVPLQRHEVPTGTPAFDWEVPKEWVVREAFMIAPDGRKLADVKENNLHLLNYSMPFKGKVSRAELDQHLHSREDLPDAIPYVTSYYAPRWGFCIPHALRRSLPDGDYEVVIDTDLIEGSLTYSDAVLTGAEDTEILVSTYTCHPSMANNELSGPLVSAFLYERLANWPKRRFTYRFVFVPETIGSIVYLSRHGPHLKSKLLAGVVVNCIGTASPLIYKRSRRGDGLLDRVVACLFKSRAQGDDTIDFFPSGSDERQYCSPGFNLPIGMICRSYPGRTPEYHTSLDNKKIISFRHLAESVAFLEEAFRVIENNCYYRNLFPYGEPQLGKRSLMSTIGADPRPEARNRALKWFLNLADGSHDIVDMAERSGLPIPDLLAVADVCTQAGLADSTFRKSPI